jgi:hypothetical protein
MNAMTKAVMTLVAFLLTLVSFSMPQSASAQSSRSWIKLPGNSAQVSAAHSADTNCQSLKGVRTDAFDPGTGISSGTISGGGWLDGTTETAINFGAGFVFTPNPEVGAFLSDTTITTANGQLKANLVTTFNLATGAFAEWGNIDATASTGRFAGATGVIFFNGRTLDSIDTGPFESEIAGQICFAH